MKQKLARKSTRSGAKHRKKIVRELFDLVMEGRPKDGLHFFSADCRQHNPYVSGGMSELFESMLAAMQSPDMQFTDPQFTLKNILSDGNMVAVYTELLGSKSKPAEGGLRQVHLFRFGRGNKIVEYWDITQQILPTMSVPANAF